MNSLLEMRVIENFVKAEKQERYKLLASSLKARKKFINELPHFRHFNWALFNKVNSFSDTIVQERLSSIGSAGNKCYVISENKSIDMQELMTAEALLHTGSDQAIIFVFGNSNLIYYEGEPPNNRYVSRLL